MLSSCCIHQIYTYQVVELIPDVYFATIQHLYKQGQSIEKIVQNVAFMTCFELYRKYGKEDVLYETFASVSADLYLGLLLSRQIEEDDVSHWKKLILQDYCKGAQQVFSRRLRIPNSSYLEPLLKQVNQAWLESQIAWLGSFKLLFTRLLT